MIAPASVRTNDNRLREYAQNGKVRVCEPRRGFRDGAKPADGFCRTRRVIPCATSQMPCSGRSSSIRAMICCRLAWMPFTISGGEEVANSDVVET